MPDIGVVGAILFYSGLTGIVAGLTQLALVLLTGQGVGLAIITFALGVGASGLGAARVAAGKESLWRPVLEAELQKWRAEPASLLRARLEKPAVYESGDTGLQVEVELIESRPDYVHVAVSVDDGTLPASIHPLTASFVCRA